MATLHARADGNFTAAATWGTVDATSLLDSEAQNTVLTTSYVSSSTFTPGVITVEGAAVKIATRAASPTGTMSLQLFNSTGAAAVAGTEVTINVSDIVSATLARNGWLFFKFAAPVVLLAATNYTVQLKTSSATQVNCYRDGTANNWARMLRTSTTAAPGAGDNWFVGGEWTAAATKTNRVVTYDGTAATDYGGGSTTIVSAGISNGGTLAYGTSASTNYVLRLSGILATWEGGVTTIGTVAVPMPATSTAVLEFDCAADGDFGWVGYGTCTAQAPSKTHHYCLLGGDEAAAQTVLSVDRDLTTFWGTTDDIVIASTSRTASQAEERTLNAIGATTITVTAGLTNAHAGTSPTQAEVGNLTRIIQIRSVTAANKAYTNFVGNAVVDFDWVLFRYCGGSATDKRAVTVNVTAAGSVSLTGCVIRDTEGEAVLVPAIAAGTLVIDSCVITGIAQANPVISLTASSIVAMTVTNTIIITSASTTFGISLGLGNVTLTNNRVQCVGTGISFSLSGGLITGTVSGNITHSCSLGGMNFTSVRGGTVSTSTIWRCATNGLVIGGCAFVTFATGTLFGNSGANIALSPANSSHLIIRGYAVNGDTTFSTSLGLQFTAASNGGRYTLENCSFGVASGILTTHTTADVDASSGAATDINFWVLNNTVLASATEFRNKTTLNGRSNLLFVRADGVLATHRREYPALGTVAYETTTVHTVGRPTQKLTPSGASTTQRLESEVFRVPVRSGEAITLGQWVQKDGSYTGSAPRLIVKANPAIGIDADLVLDTLTVAASTWERLTGTTTPVAEDDGVVECVVDCDGSAGSIYVGDGSASTS